MSRVLLEPRLLLLLLLRLHGRMNVCFHNFAMRLKHESLFEPRLLLLLFLLFNADASARRAALRARAPLLPQRGEGVGLRFAPAAGPP